MPIERLTYVALADRLKISQGPLVRLPSGANCRAHFQTMATRWCASISPKCGISRGEPVVDSQTTPCERKVSWRCRQRSRGSRRRQLVIGRISSASASAPIA
ncbi:hypothetical protein ABIF72_007702 [Bradyrhizobium japonicum]